MTDLPTPAPEPAPENAPARRQLTRRAALTFVTHLLRQGAGVITQFVVTPIVINGLGVPLFGAWTMIQQAVGYMGLGEVRPVSTLKFTLAVRQHEEDHEQKRRLIGAALRLTYLGLPFLLALGAILTWKAPDFIRVGPEYVWAVRVTMGISVLHFILNRLLMLPSNVLVGMNLDYRAMGLSAGTILLSGVLTIVAIRSGAGLPGVAAAAAIGSLIYGLGRYIVARRALSWFGSSRPEKGEVISFAKTGLWVALSGAATRVLISSDALILGFVLGPAVAAIYAMTGAAMRFAAAPMAGALASGSAGLSDLCGRREWPALLRVRAEMHLITVAVVSVVGFVTIALNRHFLLVWTGRDVYAGTLANVVLVTLTAAVLLYRTERVVAMSLLEFRTQTLTVGAAALLVVALGAAGARYVHAAAVPAAATLGYGLILFILNHTITAHTGRPSRAIRLLAVRPLVVALLLWCGALALETRIAPRSWPSLIVHAVALTSFAAAVTGFIGVGPAQRDVIVARLKRAMTAFRGRIGSRNPRQV